MKIITILINIFLVSFGYCKDLPNVEDPLFQKKIESLTVKFDNNFISVDEVNKLLNSKNFIILDAREFDEYQVSHLKGALHIGFKKFNFQTLKKNLNKGQMIIVYCSVGYRSGKIAEMLKNEGYDSYNMWGGIFEWHNKNFPLVDNHQKTTDDIHSYDENWGKWLKNKRK